jgi:hypothetical protein
MNERIKELAKQAKQSALDAMIKITDKEQALKVYSESYDTKFAELLIQQCCNAIVNDSRLSDVRTARNGCVRAIKEHFGVEE